MSYDIKSVLNVIVNNDTEALEIMLSSFLDPNTEFPLPAIDNAARQLDNGYEIRLQITSANNMLNCSSLSLLGIVICHAVTCDKNQNGALKILDLLLVKGADINQCAFYYNYKHTYSKNTNKKISEQALDFIITMCKNMSISVIAQRYGQNLRQAENVIRKLISFGADITSLSNQISQDIAIIENENKSGYLPQSKDKLYRDFLIRLSMLISKKEILHNDAAQTNYEYEL